MVINITQIKNKSSLYRQRQKVGLLFYFRVSFSSGLSRTTYLSSYVLLHDKMGWNCR